MSQKQKNNSKYVKEKSDEPLPEYVLADIRRGQEDIKAGRSISFEEFKKRLSLHQ